MAEAYQGGNLNKSFAEIHGVTPEEVKEAEKKPTHLITTEDLDTMQENAKPDTLKTALDVAKERYPKAPVEQPEIVQPTTPSAPTIEATPPGATKVDGDPLFPGAENLEEALADDANAQKSPSEPSEQTPFDAQVDAQKTSESEKPEVDGLKLLNQIIEKRMNGGSQEEISRLEKQLDDAKQDSIRQERTKDREAKRAERAKRWDNLKNGIKNAVGSVTGVAQKVASGIRNTFDKAVLTPIDRAGQDATTVIETGKSMFAGAREMITQSGREKGARTVERQLLAETGNLQSLLEKAKAIQGAMDTLKQSSAPDRMLADNNSEGLIRYAQQLGELQENLDRILDRNGGSIDELQKRANDAQERTEAFQKEYETVLSGTENPLLLRLADMLEEKLDIMTKKIDARDAARAKEDGEKTLERQQQERQQQENAQQKERRNKAQEVFGGLMRKASNGKGRLVAGVVIAMGLVISLRGGDKQNDRPVGEGRPGIGAPGQKVEDGVKAPEVAPAPNVTPAPMTEPSPSERAEVKPTPKENLTPEEKSYLDKIKGIYDTMVAKNQGNNEVIGHLTRIYDQIKANPSTHEWSLTGLDEAQFNTFVDRYFTYENMPAGPTKDAEKNDFKELLDRHNIKLGGINGPLEAPTGFVDPSGGMTKEKAQRQMTVANNIAKNALNPNLA